MNLADTYILSQDLGVLQNLLLTDCSLKVSYPHHNGFTGSMIFPVSAQTASHPTLSGISRWGRYILFKFTTCTIVVKMSHRTDIKVVRGSDSDQVKEEQVVVSLSFGMVPSERTYTLFYLDPLRCGSVSVYGMGQTPDEFSYLGIDVFDTLFTREHLYSEVVKIRTQKKSMRIKSFIMDRTVIAWLDNEFASEALFISGIHPLTDVSCVEDAMLGLLVKSIRVIYKRAVEHVRNDFQYTVPLPLYRTYSIYGREGKECVSCKNLIKKVVIDGMITYWCPSCQSEKVNDEAVL